MTPASYPLPQSFDTWVRLSADEELLELARLVQRALEGRGFTCRPEWARPAKPVSFSAARAMLDGGPGMVFPARSPVLG